MSLDKLKAKWAEMEPKHKTATLWGSIAIGVVGIVFISNDEPIKAPVKVVSESEVGAFTVEGNDVSLEAFGTQVSALSEQMTIINEKLNSVNSQQVQFKEQLRSLSGSDESIRTMFELNRKLAALEDKVDSQVFQVATPSAEGPIATDFSTIGLEDVDLREEALPEESEEATVEVPTVNRSPIRDTSVTTSIPDDPLAFINALQGGKPATKTPGGNVYIEQSTAPTDTIRSPNNIEVVDGKVTIDPASEQDMSDVYVGERILAGSFIPIQVVSGVDAPTGKAAEKGAVSSVLRITGPAILPNGYRVDMTGCYITTNVRGDTATERAYFRPDKLTCRFEYGDVDIKIKGFTSGKDGTQGFRGRVVSKQGKALLYGGIAGGVKGIGDAFGGNQNTNVSIGVGGQDPYALPESDQVFTAAASGAISDSAEFLTQYYQQKVNEMYEVIEIKPLVVGGVHVLESFTLELIEEINRARDGQ